MSPLPKFRFAAAKACFAYLHLSLNHGANVLPHLLGFFGFLNVISFTTPTSTAFVKMYFSTAAALSSLLQFSLFTSYKSSSANSGRCVYSSQDVADFA
jgi:hypothetical protein